MKITACPNCGSTQISMGPMSSGEIFGITSWNQTCKNCGYKGQPIIFESEEKYKQFLQEIKGKQSTSDACSKKMASDELTDKDKQVLELFCKYQHEKPTRSVWPQQKKWWPEIIIALCLSVVLFLSGLVEAPLVLGNEMSLLFILLSIVYNFVVLLVVIVIVEYFLRVLKNIIMKSS